MAPSANQALSSKHQFENQPWSRIRSHYFLAKNPYSKLENERKRKELELKKKIDSPKISKTTFRKDSEPSLPTDFISDAFNSVPVQGLPPGIPIVNYTNKVMNNITAVFKVRFRHK